MYNKATNNDINWARVFLVMCEMLFFWIKIKPVRVYTLIENYHRFIPDIPHG